MLALVVITATGCLRAELGVVIDDDRSGEIVLELYFNEAELGAADIDADELRQLTEAATQAMDGVDVELVKAAGEQGIKLTVPFDDYRQISSALTNANAVGQPLRAFQSFEVTEGTDGRWSMKASIDPSGFQSVLTAVPASIPGSNFDMSDLDLTLSVTLPGEVVTSNSTDVDGGTASWKLTGSDAAQSLSMDNQPGSVNLLQWALIGVGGLFIVGFLLVFLTAAGGKRRHRRGKRVKVDTNHPQDWAAPNGATGVLMPDQWSSPPPYSSHGWGEQVPTEPPVGVASPEPVGGAASNTPGLPAAPVAPPVPAVAAPPTAPPDGGSWSRATVPSDAGRAGPPVLPAGFVPTPDNAFPLTHSYSQPAEPVAPAPYTPGAAAETGGAWEQSQQQRPGVTPSLPDGFVPTPDESFPLTHSGGPPPTAVPPPSEAAEVPDPLVPPPYVPPAEPPWSSGPES